MRKGEERKRGVRPRNELAGLLCSGSAAVNKWGRKGRKGKGMRGREKEGRKDQAFACHVILC